MLRLPSPLKPAASFLSFRFRRPRKLLIGSHAFFPRFPSVLEAFLQGPIDHLLSGNLTASASIHANPPRIIRTTNCIPR